MPQISTCEAIEDNSVCLKQSHLYSATGRCGYTDLLVMGLIIRHRIIIKSTLRSKLRHPNLVAYQ